MPMSKDAKAPGPPRRAPLDGGSPALLQPRGSRVTSQALLDEVDEYFHVGAVVPPGGTVIDVGANVGAFSLRVAQRCQGDVRLLCFEPSPDTCRALRDNFETHPLLRRTQHTIHGVGLTSREHDGRELAFYNFRRFPTNNTLDLAAKRREFELFFEDRGQRLGRRVAPLSLVGGALGTLVTRGVSALARSRLGWWLSRQVMGLEEVRVRLETLDGIMARHQIARVDLLKIDVEGAELDVLQGLGQASWPRVHQVVLETHNRDGRTDAIRGLLRHRGLSNIRTTPQRRVDNGLESILLFASRSPGAASQSP